MDKDNRCEKALAYIEEQGSKIRVDDYEAIILFVNELKRILKGE